MRDSHRAEAEGLLVRAVEEEMRRSGGRTDAGTLTARGRAALDSLADAAAEEYAAYVQALDAAEAGAQPLAQRFSRGSLGTPLLVTGVAAVATFGADVAFGTATGKPSARAPSSRWRGPPPPSPRSPPRTGKPPTGGPERSDSPAAPSSCGCSGWRRWRYGASAPSSTSSACSPPRPAPLRRRSPRSRGRLLHRAARTAARRPAPARSWSSRSVICPPVTGRSRDGVPNWRRSRSGCGRPALRRRPNPPSSFCTARPAPDAPRSRCGPRTV